MKKKSFRFLLVILFAVGNLLPTAGLRAAPGTNLVTAAHTNPMPAADTKVFRVVAFFKGQEDEAHISFVKEASKWFKDFSATGLFEFDTTSDWTRLNDTFLKKVSTVIFLDARPEKPAQRAAFRRYMERGGGWLGFHFAAFALTPSAFPQDWDWYHNEFLGSGSYVSNTWRPTSALLRMEYKMEQDLPDTIRSAPNEWYRWEKDLRKNKDIRIIASIDSSSFPLGTGPKKHEIWHEGYYPVIWTNTRYKMVYFNMGHNDIDYEGKTNKTLSTSFSSDGFSNLVGTALSFVTDGLLMEWLRKDSVYLE